jgi:hypothetical protein
MISSTIIDDDGILKQFFQLILWELCEDSSCYTYESHETPPSEKGYYSYNNILMYGSLQFIFLVDGHCECAHPFTVNGRKPCHYAFYVPNNLAHMTHFRIMKHSNHKQSH